MLLTADLPSLRTITARSKSLCFVSIVKITSKSISISSKIDVPQVKELSLEDAFIEIKTLDIKSRNIRARHR